MHDAGSLVVTLVYNSVVENRTAQQSLLRV
jgi:hypothetical protein